MTKFDIIAHLEAQIELLNERNNELYDNPAIVTEEHKQYTITLREKWKKELIDAGNARAEIVSLKTALSAAKGYLMNASIDLQTGASKATAIKTIEGGIRLIDKALAE